MYITYYKWIVKKDEVKCYKSNGAEGLGDGIKDGSKDVERAMKSVTNTVEDSAKKLLRSNSVSGA